MTALHVPADVAPREAARRFADALAKPGYQAEALHEYRAPDGSPLYWRLRVRQADGSKLIRPFYRNGAGYALGEPGAERKPLYGLDRLAAAPEAPVLYVEGERCADLLGERGLLAVTAGSAQSDDKADFAPLRGRRVILWPDHDKPGAEHADRVAAKLAALGCTVERLDVAALELPDKGDCVDWLAAHPQASAADVLALPREAPKPPPPPRLALVPATEIRPEAVRWLWDGWLARGKLHILAGAPGTGKTTIALALAAVTTRGATWPDGTRCGPPANVLIWSGEDDPADTLLPRLLAMGADPRRVYFVGSVRDDATDEPRPFDPATDVPALLAAVPADGIALALVDPIVSAVAGDPHKSAEVRRDLAPLVELASLLACTVLGISHFSKGTSGRDPLERVTGSLAFGALARIVLAAAKAATDDNAERRVFARAKSNIGPDGGGFEYRLALADVPGVDGLTASRVLWGEPLEGTARELLAQAEAAEDPDERSAADECTDLLRNLLEGDAVEVKTVRAKLRAEGFTDKQIRRAREKLGVRRERVGFCGKDYWTLARDPAPEKAAAAPVDAPADHSCPVDAQTQNMGTNGMNGSNEGTNADDFEVL
jgi:hypothetical protein